MKRDTGKNTPPQVVTLGNYKQEIAVKQKQGQNK
jgi:hypothetical protein